MCVENNNRILYYIWFLNIVTRFILFAATKFIFKNNSFFFLDLHTHTHIELVRFIDL